MAKWSYQNFSQNLRVKMKEKHQLSPKPEFYQTASAGQIPVLENTAPSEDDPFQQKSFYNFPKQNMQLDIQKEQRNSDQVNTERGGKDSTEQTPKVNRSLSKDMQILLEQ